MAVARMISGSRVGKSDLEIVGTAIGLSFLLGLKPEIRTRSPTINYDCLHASSRIGTSE